MRTLIISDLHLGNGGPYDVFQGGDELPLLLDQMSRVAPLRVIVNGDGVDFLTNDDPLELDPARAVEQARAIVRHGPSRAVIEAFGHVLARGGDVTLRLGNHDVELVFPAVQAVFRSALKQRSDVAGKLAFMPGMTPHILGLGGARLLVTHGEQDDRWNKVDYEALRTGYKRYRYAPGSVLVKKILNPAIRNHGMRFLSLLKPDFHGAALSALAVDPTIAKALFKSATVGILMQLFERRTMAVTFNDGEPPPLFDPGDADTPTADPTGLAGQALLERMDLAALDDEERAAMALFLDEGLVRAFADDDESAVASASVKIARAALSIYAGLHRYLTGTGGDAYFDLDPISDEWSEAQRLAEKFGAGAVVMGHTHAARWRDDGDLLYANTGTWIGLMQLPRADAQKEDWIDYLRELKLNKELKPEAQRRARILTRFTAVLAEEHPAGGAVVSLVKSAGGSLEVLSSSRVPPARTE